MVSFGDQGPEASMKHAIVAHPMVASNPHTCRASADNSARSSTRRRPIRRPRMPKSNHARMALPPDPNLWVFPSGVVVDHGLDHPA